MEEIKEEQSLVSLLDELYDSVVEDEARDLGINIESESYRIIDNSQANFFLRRIADINKERKEIDDMCDKEIEDFVKRVNTFRNSKLVTLNNTADYLTSLLEKYAQSELIGSNKKSIKLPFGTLQFKKTQDKYEYEDEKILAIINSKQLTGLTRTKIELNKKDLKAAFTMNEDGEVFLSGELVEGAKITPGETNFSIKI